jgi:hypothetical protein
MPPLTPPPAPRTPRPSPIHPTQVTFLVTLVTYPFVYLLLTSAARGEGGGAPAPAGGAPPADGKRRLEDFPEGRAIVALERCGPGL